MSGIMSTTDYYDQDNIQPFDNLKLELNSVFLSPPISPPPTNQPQSPPPATQPFFNGCVIIQDNSILSIYSASPKNQQLNVMQFLSTVAETLDDKVKIPASLCLNIEGEESKENKISIAQRVKDVISFYKIMETQESNREITLFMRRGTSRMYFNDDEFIK
jgi:hypothetical protein